MSVNLNCIIIDDELDAQEVLKIHCKKTGFINVLQTFDNSIEALHYINHHTVDFIFLDIEMPDLNGIQFLNSFIHPPKVIMVSAYSEYALVGYEYSVIDYLLKPVSLERFLKAVQKIQISQKQDLLSDTVYIENHPEPIYPLEILFVESVGNYVKIHFKDKKMIVLHITMKNILKVLEPYGFVRCHKQFIIQKNEIQQLNNNSCLISDNINIPIGISYKQQVKNIIDKSN
ncbi:hypothetical protein AD998_11340 [bacterium 336/3]|nr:hypothetical protein AD998_11340 [bacterium 336/3]